MKKIVFIILVIAIILCYKTGEMMAETRVTTFNGEVTVAVIRDGKPTEEKVILRPGEAVVSRKVLDKVSLQRISVTWKDIAQYEAGLVARDPLSRLDIDNIWARRINNSLDLLENKFGKPPALGAILEALGIPKRRPSGKGVYKLVPGPDSPNPEKGSRVSYLDPDLNEYLDASNKVAASPAEEILTNDPQIIDASRSK